MDLNFKNVLWYPCAGNDFRDMLFFHPSMVQKIGIELMPDIYIHTDKNPIMRYEDNILFHDERTSVRIIEETPITLFEGARWETIFFDLEITSDECGVFRTKMLYCVVNNMVFLKEYILKQGIKISHLTTIRDGRDGYHRYLELFLDILGVEYFISDNLGRGSFGYQDAFDEMRALGLSQFYRSIFNRPVILKGIATLKWSKYGCFPTWKRTRRPDGCIDAIVMKVVRF